MIQIKQEELPRIFAAYPNAEIGGKGRDYIYPAMAAINFKKHIVELVYNRRNDESGYCPIDHCQLLLKNITDISDEDAIEIYKITGLQFSNTDDKYFFDLYGLADYLVEMFNDENRFSDNFTFHKSLKCIDFLRSKSYNLGYLHYSPQDLVDAGVVKIIQ